jgi:hypothetical protein
MVLLCSSFARNLAYYRAGQGTHGRPMLGERVKHAGFWRQVNSDCIDICVLDWCKLFAERGGEHHWRKVVADANVFETALLAQVGLNASDFGAYIQKIKTYRNKFVAHLDRDKVMHIPDMDIAQKALWFLHARIVTNGAQPGDLTELPIWSVQLGYDQCVAEAEEIFRAAKAA